MFRCTLCHLADASEASCDPYTSDTYGDTNGDCIILPDDQVQILSMIAARSTYIANSNSGGAIPVDPIEAKTYTLGVRAGQPITNHTKRQFNPLHNLLGPDNSVTSSSDARYNRPEISITDAIHTLRATQSMTRFISVETACVVSSLGPRPDLQVKVHVYGKLDSTGAVGRSVSSTTRVMVEAYVSASSPENDAAVAQRLFNVSKGTVIQSRHSDTVQPVSYADGPENTATTSFAMMAMYDATCECWMVQFQPFGYTGEIKHYLSVMVEQIQPDGSTTFPDGYSTWMGSSVSPYGSGTTGPDGEQGFGFSFNPVVGSPYSAISSAAAVCQSSSPPPSPPPSDPPSLPPPSPAFPPFTPHSSLMTYHKWGSNYRGRICSSGDELAYGRCCSNDGTFYTNVCNEDESYGWKTSGYNLESHRWSANRS